MDEEKPFPIEFIVILLIIAIANDIAEVCFDLLDFTGVGVAGEGIMEPINLVLDFFFTAVFFWKVGPGGGTITQYIGDLLEPFFIPARTISVGAGMWIANHPQSIVSKAASQATSLESGGINGATGELEGAGKEEARGLAGASGNGGNVGATTQQGETPTVGGGNAPESQEGSNSGSKKPDSRPSESRGAGASEDNGEGGEQIATPSGTRQDELASPEEGDPMTRVKEGIQGSEAVGFEARPKPAGSENDQPEKVVDIRSRPKPGNKNLPKAA